MEKCIFDYKSYRDYLNDWISAQPSRGRGVKGKIATITSMQATYLSQIFRGEADFTAENGHALNEFLGHNKLEARYFQLLIQHARAATKPYRDYVMAEIEEVQAEYFARRYKLSAKPLPEEIMSVYYSSWHYAGIRILLSIPQFRTIEAISERLRLPISRVKEVLDFLAKSELVVHNISGYEATKLSTFLERGSPFALQNHLNWHAKVIEMLPYRNQADIHSSGVVSVSQKSEKQVRELFRRTLAELSELTKDEKTDAADDVIVFTIDLQSI